MLLISKVHLIFQINYGKRSDLVQKDTGLLQVEFICLWKGDVPDFEDSLVSLGFKLYKARSAFSPSPAEWKSGLDEENVHLAN